MLIIHFRTMAKGQRTDSLTINHLAMRTEHITENVFKTNRKKKKRTTFSSQMSFEAKLLNVCLYSFGVSYEWHTIRSKPLLFIYVHPTTWYILYCSEYVLLSHWNCHILTAPPAALEHCLQHWYLFKMECSWFSGIYKLFLHCSLLCSCS